MQSVARYKYQSLDELIERELAGCDLVIEGCIGPNTEFKCYRMFEKVSPVRYVGLDKLNRVGWSYAIPKDLIYRIGDCTDEKCVSKIILEFGSKRPLLVTYNALVQWLLSENQNGEPKEVAERIASAPYAKQIHIHPMERKEIVDPSEADKFLRPDLPIVNNVCLETLEKMANHYHSDPFYDLFGFLEAGRCSWNVSVPFRDVILMLRK